MNPPHNKLTGRRLSSRPEVGIPLALEILADKDAHRNDILSATCYLGYRTIDGTYKDVEYIWPKILRGREWSLTIKSPDNPWFRTRWEVSYLILCIYFRIYVLKEKEFPYDLLELLCNPDHCISHPPQFVNVLRGCCIMAVAKALDGDGTVWNKYRSIGIDCYQKSIANYIITQETADSMIYETVEASEALNAILEAKYGMGKSIDPLVVKSTVDKWTTKSRQESRGPFFKTLLEMYNKK